MGMMLSAPAGNDILFDDALCEQGRNFCNKIWNAFRLVKGWEVSEEVPVPEAAELAMRWFESKQNAVAAELADLFGKYRLSEALMAVYKLFWDEFSSWYLEMIKPAYGQPINKKVYDTTIGFFDNLLHLLHPFMPFITEELWQHIVDRKDGESLMVSPISMSTEVDEAFVQQFEVVKEVISNVRSIRLQKNIAQKEPLELQVVGENPVAAFDAVIIKMCNLSAVTAVEAKADGAAAFMLEPTREDMGVMDAVLRTDGKGLPFLHIKAGGSVCAPSYYTLDNRMHYIYQEGRTVFKYAVANMADACEAVMERNHLTKEDIDWVIPHQANMRIITAVLQRLGVSPEKVMVNIERYGNTSAGTLPLCVWDFEDKLKKGDKLIFTAFGAGFAWGAIYVKWGYDGKKQ